MAEHLVAFLRRQAEAWRVMGRDGSQYYDAATLIEEQAVEISNLQQRVAELADSYDSACRNVAALHAAAVGEVRGPIRGVVEDVEDLRKERDELAVIVERLLAALVPIERHLDLVCVPFRVTNPFRVQCQSLKIAIAAAKNVSTPDAATRKPYEGPISGWGLPPVPDAHNIPKK